ncbi:MAG: hypothetical protein WC758_01715 [Candidatus Woesearchaeota archaeon]|jgi:transposase-like protein
MKCPNCKVELRKVLVTINGAKNKAVSYQCSNCDYYEFESESSKKVVEELHSVLKIKQKIVKLSQDRLGMYINKDIARSLDLKGGEEILVSLPDKKHIVIEIN